MRSTPKTNWIFILLFLCACLSAEAQSARDNVDTSYIEPFKKHLNTRFYLSQKYTSLRLANVEEDYELNYLPNTSLNLGIGATYKWATINLAYGFSFLNPDEERGKTKWLDLQTHQYFRKIAVDLFAQFYNGFYLTPAGKAANPDQAYYLRPDLRVYQVGAAAHYVFNYKKFSYRALFFQNEWQKHSAGSPLFGVELFTVNTKSDSMMVPGVISVKEGGLNTTRFTSFEFGPNLGYAYTLVIKRKFYISASGSISFNIGKNSLVNNENLSFTPNFLVRAFAGYNSKKWSIGIVAINNGLSLAHLNYNERVTLHSGNIRLNYVYRFLPKGRTKGILKPIDKIGN